MSVEREPEPAPLQRVGQESVVAGPVVPTGRAASPGREVTAEGVWSPEPQAAFVQREVTAEAPAPSPPAAPAVGVEAPEAPLLGSRVEGVASVERSAQQTSYDDLPVVPVARGVELSQEWSGPDDVPRLAVATFAPPSVPSTGSTGSIGSTGAIQASSHPHDASAVGSWPVVARAATTGTVPTVARAATTGNVPTGARAVEAPTRTASLTGTHPIVAQRAGVEPLQRVSTPALERVQPLRFEGLGGSTTTPTTTPTTTLPSPPAVPSTADPSLATGPSLQRSSGSFPAVAPGLVGPGPVISGPILPGPAAADPGPALSVVTFPAPGSAAVDLEPVTVSRTTDLPIWSPPAPAAPREGGTRPRTWAEQPVQRLAAPLPTAPTARPTTARSLSFDQMFGGTGAPGTSDADAGWTTVDLPVVTEGSASVQRAVDTAAITTEPAPAPTPEPSPAPAADGASSAAPAAPPAAAAPAPGGADLDEMARRLFDPLSARLKAELWLDRERAGLVADAHF